MNEEEVLTCIEITHQALRDEHIDPDFLAFLFVAEPTSGETYTIRFRDYAHIRRVLIENMQGLKYLLPTSLFKTIKEDDLGSIASLGCKALLDEDGFRNVYDFMNIVTTH